MNYLALIGRDGVIFICGLFSSIFLARHLGPSIYGEYVLLLLIISYPQQFGRFSFSQAIIPYLKNNSQHEKIVFSLAFGLSIFLWIIVSIIFLLLSKHLAFFENYSFWIYPVVSVMILSEFLLVFMTYALTFQQKYKILSFITSLRPVLSVLGIIGLYFLFDQNKNIFPYLFVGCIASFIVTLIGLYFVKNYINNSFFSFRELELKNYFDISLKFYLSEVVSFLSSKGITTFVAVSLSSSSLAFYNLLFNHFELLRFPNNALGSMMYPELAKEKDDKKQRSYVLRKIGFNFVVYVPIFVIAYFAYPILVKLFYGDDYLVISSFFPLILSFGSIYLITYPVCHYFSANGAPHYTAMHLLFSLAFQAGLVLFFVSEENFSLTLAIISQLLGLISYTFVVLVTYKFKNFD